MATSSSDSGGEGLRIARFLMVLSSISPLFVLWAIRGTNLVPNCWLIAICTAMVVVPFAILWIRRAIAYKQRDSRELCVGKADDHRDHILVYLFAMMLPFYSEDLDTWRNLASSLAALTFIVFLFWHLNLHYVNFWFALMGYHVFTVNPIDDNNPNTGRTSVALITRRASIVPGERLVAYRLSDTVYMEIK